MTTPEIKFKMIFAYSADDNVFGNADKLPWSQHIKKDMQVFKEFTNNCVLVMGRKTFESLPCKLRGLPHYVITSEMNRSNITNKKGENPDFVHIDIESTCIAAAEYSAHPLNTTTDVCIIGGASVLKDAAKFVDEAMITKVYFNNTERYYDAPKYIDIDSIEESLSNNHFIALENTKKYKYTLNDDGEIKELLFTHYTNTL